MASNKITDCIPELQKAWPRLKAEFESMFPGWTMKLTYTHRTPEEQFEIYKEGRIYNYKTKEWDRKTYFTNDGREQYESVLTFCDGTKRLSGHNYYPAKAFDVALQKPDKDFEWDDAKPQWRVLPSLGEAYGLKNLGPAIGDWCHFELA